ncbi:FAD-dependent monooxygenase [Microbacterium resistens]|uniref:FAD-dependent oxidoreductase n=1 Tax=Microbacterium resistens TaxID=156977 RepID=UPI001C5859C1|nr:NAD(P)/FAD-dependent oxidoreductase [Microbacterium resistens]MBW1640071.1 FAD-dependent monooxygenase [Microbacterium resistens]
MSGAGTAEVVGGGIAGLSTAIALAQRGWRVTLHERQDRIRAVGAGIYLWDNGLAALESLGAFDDATRGARIAPAVEARSRLGRTLYRIPINAEGRTRCFTVLRETLIDALRSAAEASAVDLRTTSTCLDVDPAGTLTLADEERRADLIVCADGVGSRLRDRLGLLQERVQMRRGAARMMIRTTPGDDLDAHAEYFGPRRRVLVTPCTPELTYVALVSEAGDDAGAGSSPAHGWERDFPALASLLRAEPVAVVPWSRFELVRLTAWSRGRVAVLGDAAHAQPPYLGQGGGTAMMNALSLAHAVTGAPEMPNALRVWERRQRPAVERTQLTSFRMRGLDRLPNAPRSALLRAAGVLPGVQRSALAATRERPAIGARSAPVLRETTGDTP